MRSLQRCNGCLFQQINGYRSSLLYWETKIVIALNNKFKIIHININHNQTSDLSMPSYPKNRNLFLLGIDNVV